MRPSRVVRSSSASRLGCTRWTAGGEKGASECCLTKACAAGVAIFATAAAGPANWCRSHRPACRHCCCACHHPHPRRPWGVCGAPRLGPALCGTQWPTPSGWSPPPAAWLRNKKSCLWFRVCSSCRHKPCLDLHKGTVTSQADCQRRRFLWFDSGHIPPQWVPAAGAGTAGSSSSATGHSPALWRRRCPAWRSGPAPGTCSAAPACAAQQTRCPGCLQGRGQGGDRGSALQLEHGACSCAVLQRGTKVRAGQDRAGQDRAGQCTATQSRSGAPVALWHSSTTRHTTWS